MGCEDLFSTGNLKKRGRQFLLVFSLCFLCAALLFAGSDTGADFLKVPTSARPVALGNAYTALASGTDALERNPAGFAQSPAALAFSHQQIFTENSLDYVSTVLPGRTRRSPAWGFSISRLSYASQEERGKDRAKTGSFSASDMAIGVGIAHAIGSIELGTQVKIIRQDLAGYSAHGFAVDMGFLSATPLPRLRLGGAVRNLGPRMKFVDEDFNLPLMISAGGAYSVLRPLKIAFDVQISPYQRQTTAALGLEFSAIEAVTLRAGYLNKLAQAVSSRQESEINRGNFGGIGGLAGGLGFKFGQFKMDYGFAPFGELGDNHIFTVTTFFGGAAKEPSAEKSSREDHNAVAFPTGKGKSWWEK